MSEEIKVITIENGSNFIKAGFSSARKDEPDYTILKKSVTQPVKQPVKQSVKEPVTQPSFEQICKYTFDKLNVVPAKSGQYPGDNPILLTVSPLTSDDDKNEMTKIMFEKFNVSSLYIATDAEMALFATGKETGIVLHSTEGVTHIVPVFKGSAISTNDAIIPFNICGKDLTNFLMKLLNEKLNEKLNKNVFLVESDIHRSIVDDIKKTICEVVIDYNEASEKNSSYNLNKNYKLPDNNNIYIGDIGNADFKCPELLFKPSLNNSVEQVGIHIGIINSIMRCPKNIHEDLFKNIILSGENTVFPGFAERLKKEIETEIENVYKKVYPDMDITEIEVFESDKKIQENLAWIGGSKLSTLDRFRNLYITKQVYDEQVENIVKKIF